MTDNQSNKKTLRVKTPLKTTEKKLSVKLGSGIKITKKRSNLNTENVVVIRKSRKIQHSDKKDATLKKGNAATLTEQEKARRIKVLKNAEESTSKLADENKVSKVESKQEKGVENNVLLDKSKENNNLKTSTTNLNQNDTTQSLQKGKIKNLDAIYTVEEANISEKEVISEKVVKDQVEKVNTQNISTLPPKYTKEKKHKDEIVNKKLEERKNLRRKLSVTQVMSLEQDEEKSKHKFSPYKKSLPKKESHSTQKVEKVYREVTISDHIKVQELANRMTEKVSDVVKALMKLGVIVNMNQHIDADTAEVIITEFGHKVKRITSEDFEKNIINEIIDSEDSLKIRAPVVTVMGHVDHGKTSLLDALRLTDVAAKESGGITQHIGAYKVTLKNGHSITFLDTPGHEAFTAMRVRGAKVTDIVIIVVAADDGIKEQTIEAINHAKAANVPIIVAINKIDKPGADPNKTKTSLLSYGLISEDSGGDVMTVEVSALKKIGLEKLEDAVILQAEILELKANPNRLAQGVVLESKIDKGRGVMASFLVQKGTLKIGDMLIAGRSYGKIRALIDDKGKSIKSATPSTPVEILGLNIPPEAGDEFIVTSNEKSAKQIVNFRLQKEQEKKILSFKKDSLESMIQQSLDGDVKELQLIVKADVHGSLEAIIDSLNKLPNDEASVKILHSGVGVVTESDVVLAGASNALILSFNVRENSKVREMAKNLGVTVKYYSIIYDLVNDMKNALFGMLSSIQKENVTGYAEVRQVFNLSKAGKVAGCYVTEGKVVRNSKARLLRDGTVIHEGKLKALKRFKEDVKEAGIGFECGISFESYGDIKEGDKIEAYEMIDIERKI